MATEGTLFHKRILVAADEEHFRGQGIGAHLQAHVRCYIFHFFVQAGVLRAQRYQISKIVKQRDAVHVDVGRDFVDGDSWVMSKLV
jgi:hypothetical protein